MNLSGLFSTEERVKLLEQVIYNVGDLSVNKVADELSLSKGLVSKFFHILTKEKIMTKRKNKFLIQDNIHTRAIKILLNLAQIDVKLFDKYRFIKSVGLYGSSVKGKNTLESDVDLWILTKKTEEENLAKLTNELKKRDMNIRILYLTEEKLKILKEEDTVFYHSLIFGSVTIYGEEIEAL